MQRFVWAFGLAALVSVVGSCSGSTSIPDGGGTGGGAGGSGGDAGTFSACGHPGDIGNDLKVGQYCKVIADCPSSAQICTSFQNSSQPEALRSFFCTTTCSPCDPPSVCGTNALCVCQGGPDACGCVPKSCAALIPDGGVLSCPKTCDGGTADAGDGGC